MQIAGICGLGAKHDKVCYCRIGESVSWYISHAGDNQCVNFHIHHKTMSLGSPKFLGGDDKFVLGFTGATTTHQPVSCQINNAEIIELWEIAIIPLVVEVSSDGTRIIPSELSSKEQAAQYGILLR